MKSLKRIKFNYFSQRLPLTKSGRWRSSAAKNFAAAPHELTLHKKILCLSLLSVFISSFSLFFTTTSNLQVWLVWIVQKYEPNQLNPLSASVALL